jgi:NNP family nitrate/nitrite transporter-like MFS transporter
MIPVIFRRQHLGAVAGQGPAAEKKAMETARRKSAAVLGFTSAVGACGGYLIPRTFGASIKATGSAELALTAFLIFYATCIGLTWWFYARRAPAPAASLAEARI